MEESREKLSSWLIELITQFRAGMAKLPEEDRKNAPGSLGDLTYPCQITVIWAKDPEFQIIVITRLRELQDKLIQICGPVDNVKLTERIENEATSYSTISSIGKDKTEDFLVGALRTIRKSLDPVHGLPKESMILTEMRISNDPYAAIWSVCGSLANLRVGEVADRFVREVVSASRPSASHAPREDVLLKGFGAYLYPSVWIGEIPKPRSFNQKLLGPGSWMPMTSSLANWTYKQEPLAVTMDGYIAIGEDSKPRALESLNQIGSTLLVLGKSLQVLREDDLGEATFTGTGYSIAAGPNSPEPWYLIDSEHLLPRRTLIPKEEMEKAVKWAETLTSDVGLRTLLLLFLEFHTHFSNNEHKQALVMGWVILEDFRIKNLWTQLAKKATSDKNRLNKLASWDVDRQLETLSLAHMLDEDEYDSLMRIKDARNETVHEGKEPAKEIVEECSGMILGIARKHIGTQLGKSLARL